MSWAQNSNDETSVHKENHWHHSIKSLSSYVYMQCRQVSCLDLSPISNILHYRHTNIPKLKIKSEVPNISGSTQPVSVCL